MKLSPHFPSSFPFLPNAVHCLAALYILLTVFAIACYPPLAIQDFLAPFLAVYVLWHWRRAVSIFAESGFTLPAFLMLALLASIYHASHGTGGFYDFAVFAYMALLYAFFRLLPLEKNKLGQGLGLSILVILLGSFCVGITALIIPGVPGKCLFFFDPHSGSRGLSLLAVRYQFLFNNPNLLGSFYILPVALVQAWLTKKIRQCKKPQHFLLLFIAIGFCLLPLLSTASKHALMTLAILAGTLLEAWPEKRKWLRPIAVGVVALFASICLLTVLWPVFPISPDFPYLNFSHQGNYTIHQEIYLKMLADKKSSWITGLGSNGIRQKYPQFADQEKITFIMEQYRSPHCVEPYCTYMDPHNEYLNLASLFGVPAMLCCFAFWLWHLQGRRYSVFLFIMAVFFCCLWDDLFSKRWIYMTLAIMTTAPHSENSASA